METLKKSPVKLMRERTPKEVKAMRFINIFMLSFVGALLLGIVLCAINGLGEIACMLGCVMCAMLWNYRIIRSKYARGL